MYLHNRFKDPASRSFVSMFILGFAFLIAMFLSAVSYLAASSFINLASFILMILFFYLLLFFLGYSLGGYLLIGAAALSAVAGLIAVSHGSKLVVMVLIIIAVITAIYAQESSALKDKIKNKPRKTR